MIEVILHPVKKRYAMFTVSSSGIEILVPYLKPGNAVETPRDPIKITEDTKRLEEDWFVWRFQEVPNEAPMLNFSSSVGDESVWLHIKDGPKTNGSDPDGTTLTGEATLGYFCSDYDASHSLNSICQVVLSEKDQNTRLLNAIAFTNGHAVSSLDTSLDLKHAVYVKVFPIHLTPIGDSSSNE